jgi:hypothetical protein
MTPPLRLYRPPGPPFHATWPPAKFPSRSPPLSSSLSARRSRPLLSPFSFASVQTPPSAPPRLLSLLRPPIQVRARHRLPLRSTAQFVCFSAVGAPALHQILGWAPLFLPPFSEHPTLHKIILIDEILTSLLFHGWHWSRPWSSTIAVVPHHRWSAAIPTHSTASSPCLECSPCATGAEDADPAAPSSPEHCHRLHHRVSCKHGDRTRLNVGAPRSRLPLTGGLDLFGEAVDRKWPNTVHANFLIPNSFFWLIF